jgi:serine/threonine-protein kinase
MALTPGTRLGAYEVLALLGSGGMGEVYRARDTRLDRIVAIKVLRADVANDRDRRQRLDREARAISSLNHPHICILHDVGHQDGIDYLVMELLEGQTLAERLTRGALPLDQAVQYAIQLADALDVAHRRGLVHRDVKPANIFLARSGSSGAAVSKLLDFGIAKAMPLGPASANAAATLTHEGIALGTLQYLAPEQLEGRDADSRSDLFAFGAVLYEMVTGRRAFSGDSQASVIAAVLDFEPPPLSSRSPTPPALEHLVKTCLAKNPDERWQAAGDVKRQLEWIAASGRSMAQATTAGQRSGRGMRVTWTVAVMTALVALIAGSAVTWYARTRSQGQAGPPRVTRTTIVTSGTAALALRGRSLAITPDGTRVVYIGNNGTQLFVRPIDRFDSTLIFTSVGPLNDVFISPDGMFAGFIEGARLKTIAITGGPAETIVAGIAGLGATWAPDNTIIFPTPDPATGLHRVPAAGGDVRMLTQPLATRGELAHLWPAMLPGGRAVLFTITATTGGLDGAQIAVLDLVTGRYKVLLRGGSDSHYVPSERGSTQSAERTGGHLVYVKGATLMAIPFDPARLETNGTPVMVLPRLATKPYGNGVFDVTDDGTLVYVEPDARDTTSRSLVWVDRQGLEKPLSSSLPSRPYGQPRLSPDGTRVAVSIEDRENDIWVWDIAGQAPLRQLTSGPLMDFFAVWTTDSRHVIFGRPTGGLFRRAADGTGNEEVLSTAAPPPLVPSAVTPDGSRVLLPSAVTPDGTRVLLTRGPLGIMAMTLNDRRVEPLVQQTPFNDRNGVVSPDGRWLAYEANGTQRFEIYVRPYPNVMGGPWQVSTAGGTRPLWSPNGRELFFVAPDGAIMAASVDSRGRVWRSGTPVKVVDGRYSTGAPVPGRNYDVSTDGRFLVVKAPPNEQSAAPQIQFVQHWAEELQRLVPATR